MSETITNISNFADHKKGTVEEVLTYAKTQNLASAIVIGTWQSGQLAIFSNDMTRRDALWLIEICKLHVLKIEENPYV